MLAGNQTDWGLELLRDPIRLELNPGTGLAYAEHADPAFPVILRPDIEQLNFGVVQAKVPADTT